MSMSYKTIKVCLVKNMKYKNSIGVWGRAPSEHAERGRHAAPHASSSYVTTCGLVPSSVRSYLSTGRGRQGQCGQCQSMSTRVWGLSPGEDTHHWVQPLASSSDARATSTCGRRVCEVRRSLAPRHLSPLSCSVCSAGLSFTVTPILPNVPPWSPSELHG